MIQALNLGPQLIEDILKSKIQNCILAIANPVAQKELSSKLLLAGKKFPNILHPSAYVGNSNLNQIGIGNIFTYGFYMTTNTVLGSFNIFNTRVTVGHDVQIGSFNIFLPNVQISGNVKIGEENIFGMGSSVLHNKTIGSRNKIGAHSFVATNIESDLSVFGIPAVNI